MMGSRPAVNTRYFKSGQAAHFVSACTYDHCSVCMGQKETQRSVACPLSRRVNLAKMWHREQKMMLKLST
jgi:hypothetical protein